MGVVFGNFGGGVGGAVVQDGQVPMGVCLGEDAIEGLGKIVLAVVDGHHEGDNVGHLSCKVVLVLECPDGESFRYFERYLSVLVVIDERRLSSF